MKFLLTIVITFISIASPGQSRVVWSYTTVKKAAKVYEIRLMAEVGSGWHIYSQHTPEGGPLPTAVSFTKNPLIDLSGEVKEVGELITRHEEVFDIDTKFYINKVEFVQLVKLKNNVKTIIGGAIKFMVCTDQQCLPPATVNFSLALR